MRLAPNLQVRINRPQQGERIERVLKTLWRDRHESQPDWIDHYRKLENDSEQIRQTALTILHNLLPGQ